MNSSNSNNNNDNNDSQHHKPSPTSEFNAHGLPFLVNNHNQLFNALYNPNKYIGNHSLKIETSLACVNVWTNLYCQHEDSVKWIEKASVKFMGSAMQMTSGPRGSNTNANTNANNINSSSNIKIQTQLISEARRNSLCKNVNVNVQDAMYLRQQEDDEFIGNVMDTIRSINTPDKHTDTHVTKKVKNTYTNQLSIIFNSPKPSH